ncbi:hypothetical protein Sjap_017099 [Stephania japonica]|uniref:Uncharacterized protein n=1 Tax=Stephania japonica TaxID=461633 RepID=A0AAP0I5I8_9MAGN
MKLVNEPQIINGYLNHLESMLKSWRSRSPGIIRDESYYKMMLESYEGVWSNIEEILKYGPKEVEERAKGLRRKVEIDTDDLLTKRMEALEPLLDCVGRMATRRFLNVEEMENIERESCAVCMEDFGVLLNGKDARISVV